MRTTIFFRCISVLCILPILCCGQQDKNGDIIPSDDNEIVKTRFGFPKNKGTLQGDEINEASGLVSSNINENALWVHNDSGNQPLLFLLDTGANIKQRYFLEGVENRDWEDMALGPGPNPDLSYIYLGEIGDNSLAHQQKIIYRFAEPTFTESDKAIDTVRNIEVLRFVYEDQRQNAEALLVDPATQDIYIIAKRDGEPTLYNLANVTFNTQEPLIAKAVGTLRIQGAGLLSLVTASDVSRDGKEVLVKTYGKIYYWYRENTEISLADLLLSEPDTIRYEPEPQGEAIAFSISPDGFFTLSEKNFGQKPILYFYPRK